MARAQVWNDNVHPHTEKFKEVTISIAPKSFVEMDLEEAIEFKCQFTPIKTDGEKNPIPESFKMIRVVKLEEPKTIIPLVCHATGKLASSSEDLARMNAEHIGTLAEGAKREIEERESMKSEIELLKAQIAAISEAKRGPGRPRKDA